MPPERTTSWKRVGWDRRQRRSRDRAADVASSCSVAAAQTEHEENNKILRALLRHRPPIPFATVRLAPSPHHARFDAKCVSPASYGRRARRPVWRSGQGWSLDGVVPGSSRARSGNVWSRERRAGGDLDVTHARRVRRVRITRPPGGAAHKSRPMTRVVAAGSSSGTHSMPPRRPPPSACAQP